MAIKPIKLQNYGATVGYLIISCIAVIGYTLATQDNSVLVFGIPLVLILALGASIDKGKPDRDLAEIGWTDDNLELWIPLGIIGGMGALFLGSILMQFTPATSAMITASLIPDFSSALRIASVIPVSAALGINILAQFLIVAPSEESISKILAPLAGMSFLKNTILAYAFGAMLWMSLHISTFILNSTPISMYGVLAILAAITLGIYFITKSLFSAVIAHSTFNTGVLLLSAQINMVTYYVLFGVSAILVYIWLKGDKNGKANK